MMLTTQEAIERFSSMTGRAVLIWAGKNLERLGDGTSRDVFVLNSRRVLKVSNSYLFGGWDNEQNEEEVRVWNLSRSPVLAQVFYYAEDFSWLIVERLPDTLPRQPYITGAMRRLARKGQLCLGDIVGDENQIRFHPRRGNVLVDYGWNPVIQDVMYGR